MAIGKRSKLTFGCLILLVSPAWESGAMAANFMLKSGFRQGKNAKN